MANGDETSNAPPLSDRRLWTPNPGVGFDTIRLRGPAPGKLLDALEEHRVSRTLDPQTGDLTESCRSGWTYVTVGKTDVRVFVNQRTATQEVRVEFSGPAVMDGHNLNLLAPRLLNEMIGSVLHALGRVLPGVPDPGEVRLTRLDLARDFVGVADPAETLMGLARLAPRTAKFQQAIHFRRGNPRKVQTLTRSVGQRWVTRAYDKRQELGERARGMGPSRRGPFQTAMIGLPSILRWELQLEHRLMPEWAPVLMSQDEAQIFERTEAYFINAGFAEVTTGGRTRLQNATHALIARDQRNEAQRVLCHLASELIGVNLHSHNTRDLARATAKEWGLRPDDLVASGAIARRLDFRIGKQVTGDAALEASAAVIPTAAPAGPLGYNES